MIRRIGVTAGLSVLGSLIAATGAFANTATVGQLFPPTLSCSGSFTYLQTAAVGNSYVIPFNGTITSWSFQDAATPVTGLKLKVGRAVGGQYVIDAEAAAGTQTPNTVNTYSANIPVKAGQFIGMTQAGGDCASPAPGYTFTAFTGDVTPSSTPVTPLGMAAASVPIQATVQEAPTGQRAAALKKCKKKHSHKARKKCKKKANLLPI